jgi:hypothetical protein
MAYHWIMFPRQLTSQTDVGGLVPQPSWGSGSGGSPSHTHHVGPLEFQKPALKPVTEKDYPVAESDTGVLWWLMQ